MHKLVITQLMNQFALNLFGFFIMSHIMLGSCNKRVGQVLMVKSSTKKKRKKKEKEKEKEKENIIERKLITKKDVGVKPNPPKKPRRSPKKGKVSPTNNVKAA